MNYGLVSVFIPILVIILAAFTKRIIPSLIIGLLTGGILFAKGNIINGLIIAIEHLVKSLSSEDSIYIILFLFIFGAFGEIMKVSGGIKGLLPCLTNSSKLKRGLWVQSGL
ncbi:hypothetical protein SDC9_127778 [bioreactor metagenome]|uniref:Na+/H+ antiporter NhaC-like C-terminal domain-containing protein n=1 Tax=bioreactor metagenome TaxID=1076179 RepID=A0A645CV53_9ZZZZ